MAKSKTREWTEKKVSSILGKELKLSSTDKRRYFLFLEAKALEFMFNTMPTEELTPIVEVQNESKTIKKGYDEMIGVFAK